MKELAKWLLKLKLLWDKRFEQLDQLLAKINSNHMNKLHFDFEVDKEKNTLTMRREFAAGRQLVWDCYTKQEFLDQWFAPKPMTTQTKSMEFKNGGHWQYAMVDLDDREYWGYTAYHDIKPIDSYDTMDSFCDEKGVINKELPTAKWHVNFSDNDNHSVVETVVYYDSWEDLETTIKMGMEEGMKSTLERLDDLLISLTQK